MVLDSNCNRLASEVRLDTVDFRTVLSERVVLKPRSFRTEGCEADGVQNGRFRSRRAFRMDGSEIATNLLANPAVWLDPVGFGTVRSERAVLNSRAFRTFRAHGSEAAGVQKGSEADGPSERTALKPRAFQNGRFRSRRAFQNGPF